MKIESLIPGQVVYDCRSTRMGNTMLRTVSVWRIRIESISEDKKTVIASWNSNPTQRFFANQVSKWKAKEPELVRNSFGQARRKTRQERLQGSADRV